MAGRGVGDADAPSEIAEAHVRSTDLTDDPDGLVEESTAKVAVVV